MVITPGLWEEHYEQNYNGGFNYPGNILLFKLGDGYMDIHYIIFHIFI